MRIKYLLALLFTVALYHVLAGAGVANAQLSMRFPWDRSIQARYTGGPHGFGVGIVCSKESVAKQSGLDFATGYKFEVLAVASGTLVDINTDPEHPTGKGKFTVINHDGGWQTQYWHLDSIGGITVGQPIPQGTLLGSAGETGGAQGIHLHLELRRTRFTGDKNGVQERWDGKIIDGWRVKSVWEAVKKPIGWVATGNGYNYKGTMTKGLFTGSVVDICNAKGFRLTGSIDTAEAHPTRSLLSSSNSKVIGACPIAPGQGSSRQQAFIAAYNRNGGRAVLGCALETVRWWPNTTDPKRLVKQEFQGGSGVGVSALLHDQLADNADPLGVPAYMVQGGFWTGFYKNTGPFLGAPASDHYINAFGKPQTDFRNGFAWWTGVANWRRPLVKGSAASVYFIERGKKRGIPNPDTLFALGYGWGDVQTVTDTELSQYPTGSLIPDINTTWLAQYYDNRLWLRPSKVARSESAINFNWGLGAPAPGLPVDSFSARFSRYFNLTGGEYEFNVSVDDGVWFYLDGNLLFSRGLGSSTFTKTLPSGRHLLELRYREYTAPAYLSLSFEPTDTLPPVADIGGPYVGNEGDTLTFDASSSYDPEPGTGIAQIEWDLDEDGSFDDFVGSVLSKAYGDDTQFNISIKVTDGAGNFSTDSTTVTIENVAPTITLDKSNVTSFGGGNAFVATLDDLISFPLSITDPGSDDLTIFTNFGDGNAQADVFFNDPNVGPDPFPSIEINPRDINIAKPHQYQIPSVYQLLVTAVDDDGGVAEDSLIVLITANQTEIRTQGFWKNQYGEDLGEGVQYHQDFLFGFWNIAKFVSKVFDEVTSAQTLSEIEDILSQDGEGNPMIERAQTQCLAALLNFSSGSIKWDSQVDTDFDGVPDKTFSQAITQAEDFIANPASTEVELEQAKDTCDSINNTEKIATAGGLRFAFLLAIPVLFAVARILIRFI